MTQLYKIEENFTAGWELIDASAQKLTKEECDQKLRHYLSQGYNPNYLRVVKESEE
jgi:hypothetical protein